MAHVNPGRPTEGEYPPLFAAHVNRVPDGEILDILDR